MTRKSRLVTMTRRLRCEPFCGQITYSRIAFYCPSLPRTGLAQDEPQPVPKHGNRGTGRLGDREVHIALIVICGDDHSDGAGCSPVRYDCLDISTGHENDGGLNVAEINLDRLVESRSVDRNLGSGRSLGRFEGPDYQVRNVSDEEGVDTVSRLAVARDHHDA